MPAMMWSAPPAEPPAKVTRATSFFTAAARSLASLIGELAGTTMTCVSSVSRAIGVTWLKLSGDLLSRMAPTMTKPLTISVLPSPLLLTNCANPTVPPAPGMLITCALLTSFSAVIACCRERAVWSQPPPGAAGAMSLSSIWAAADVARAVANVAAIAPDHASFTTDIAQPPLNGDLNGLAPTVALFGGAGQRGEKVKSAGEAVVVEIGLLGGRRGASEDGVAMGKTPKTADDVGVQLGPVQEVRIVEQFDQRAA